MRTAIGDRIVWHERGGCQYNGLMSDGGEVKGMWVEVERECDRSRMEVGKSVVMGS